MVYYKIKHRVTGLYSKGGGYVSANGTGYTWSKTGKTWDTLGKLRAHITSHLPKNIYGKEGTDMRDWQVVEYAVTVQSVKGIKDVIDPKKLLELLSM